MNKLRKLIGEGRAIFASVLCLLTIGLLAPSALSQDGDVTIRVGASVERAFLFDRVRWWKLTNGVASVASAAFVSPATQYAGTGYEGLVSAKPSDTTYVRLTGVEVGTTEWHLFSYTDAGQEAGGDCPGYENARYGYPSNERYERTGQWSGEKDGSRETGRGKKVFTVTVLSEDAVVTNDVALVVGGAAYSEKLTSAASVNWKAAVADGDPIGCVELDSESSAVGTAYAVRFSPVTAGTATIVVKRNGAEMDVFKVTVTEKEQETGVVNLAYDGDTPDSAQLFDYGSKSGGRYWEALLTNAAPCGIEVDPAHCTADLVQGLSFSVRPTRADGVAGIRVARSQYKNDEGHIIAGEGSISYRYNYTAAAYPKRVIYEGYSTSHICYSRTANPWTICKSDNEGIATATVDDTDQNNAVVTITGVSEGTTFVTVGNPTAVSGDTSYTNGAIYTLWVEVKRTGPKPVSVEVNENLVYNGLIQTGVAENAGYTLLGTSVATNAATYSVIATLNDGYYWENGSEKASTNIFWKIARAPVTLSAVDCEKVYGSADPEPLPVEIVGTNGFDGAVITYDISRDVGETVGSYEINFGGVKEEQGNYLVSFGDKTKATFTINWADPYTLVLDDVAFTVKVTRVWLERDEFRQDQFTPDQLRAKLQEKSIGDDFPMWQKYLINLDTNAQFYVAAPENFDPDTVSIVPAGIKDRTLAEPVDEATSGVKVQFRLDEGLGEDRRVVVPAQDETTLKVPLAGNPNSSNYLAYVVFTQNGYKYEQPFRNYIGILKSEPYTTSGGAREFVAVPWNRYDGAANGLAVTNIVKTALLSEGDKLYYRISNEAFGYYAWELDADKKWQPIASVGYGPNGCWSNQVTKTTNSDKIIKLGGALWLDRKDATTGVVFVGGGRTRGKPDVTTKTYVYACSPLGLTELDVKTLDCRKGARVIIPTPGAPIIWTHDGTKWSSEEQVVDEFGIVRTQERKDSKIKPGRGYWLDRTAEVPLAK